MSIDLSDKPKGYIHKVNLPSYTWKVYLTNGNSYEYTRQSKVYSCKISVCGWRTYQINEGEALISKPDSPLGGYLDIIKADDGTEINKKYIIAQKEIYIKQNFKVTAHIKVIKPETIFSKVKWTCKIDKEQLVYEKEKQAD